MKKSIGVTMIVLSLIAGNLFAGKEGKRMNILAGAGSADSDFEGGVIEIGIEKQMSGKFYTQLMVDYYCNPVKPNDGFDSYALGLNLSGVYKFPISGGLHFFLKGGVHLTLVREHWAYLSNHTSADLGVLGGGGMELKLSGKTSLYAGVTFKTAIEESRSWYKCSGGINYRIK
jgi:hypothetical protein